MDNRYLDQILEYSNKFRHRPSESDKKNFKNISIVLYIDQTRVFIKKKYILKINNYLKILYLLFFLESIIRRKQR